MIDYNDKYEEFKYEVISETEDGQLKQLYWNIAFGLQDVDNLKPSKYMIELATENIYGKKTISDVEEEIKSYYDTDHSKDINEQEADIVSVRLVQLLSDKSFRFDYNTYRIYHQYLFDGIDIGISEKYIGNFRDYNISKVEPILNGASVAYTNHFLIKTTLEYDFKEEKNYDYLNKSLDEIVSHIATFTSHIWQVHPFGEGNTRTTALFIQKYIQYLGLGEMNNEIFKDNSKYFRNALVRANYSDLKNGIHEDDSYLNKFFSNLLLETDFELNNEELYIYDRDAKIDNELENDENDLEL